MNSSGVRDEKLNNPIQPSGKKCISTEPTAKRSIRVMSSLEGTPRTSLSLASALSGNNHPPHPQICFKEMWRSRTKRFSPSQVPKEVGWASTLREEPPLALHRAKLRPGTVIKRHNNVGAVRGVCQNGIQHPNPKLSASLSRRRLVKPRRSLRSVADVEPLRRRFKNNLFFVPTQQYIKITSLVQKCA